MYWKGYQGAPGLMRVVRADVPPPCGAQGDRDCVAVFADRLVFGADGYTYALSPEQREQARGLHTGDIISVDARGIVRRLFDVTQHDATVFVTGRCNSNCVMCPASDRERMQEDERAEGEVARFVSLLPEDVAHIVVTGGEPTLRAQLFFRVMGQLAERFPRTDVLLLTNGRCFASRQMAERLVEHCPAFLKVAVALHGADPRLHDAVTRAPGSFRQTCLGLGYLLRRNVDIEIRVVVSKRNVACLSEIARLIAGRFPTAGIVNFMALEARGNCAKHFHDLYIDCRGAFPFVRQAADILISRGIDVSLYNFPLCAVEKGYWPLYRKSISPWKVRFPADCEGCEAKRYCGGFFDTTLRMARPAVFPMGGAY